MHRRYALGGLTPPAAAAFIEEPQLITKCQVGGGWCRWLDGWKRMPRAGVWRGLGARLIAGWSEDSGEGVGSRLIRKQIRLES